MVLSNPTKFPVNIPIIQFWECFVWRWCPPTYKYGMLFLWMCWMGSKLRRRKFRSQTCDSMEGWKSKGGKSPRRERKKKSEQRRDRKKKQDPGARKGRKVAKHCVFSMVLWGYHYVAGWLWAGIGGGGRAVVGRPWYPYHPEHRIWVTINKLPTLYFGIGLNDFYIPCIQGTPRSPLGLIFECKIRAIIGNNHWTYMNIPNYFFKAKIKPTQGGSSSCPPKKLNYQNRRGLMLAPLKK